MLTKKMSAKIRKWNKLQIKLREIKEQESDLRDEIALKLNENFKEGTYRYDLSQTEIVKLEQQYRYDVDVAELKRIAKKLPPGILTGLVRNKVTLSVGAYKKLGADVRSTFDRCLTKKPSKPALSLKVTDV